MQKEVFFMDDWNKFHQSEDKFEKYRNPSASSVDSGKDFDDSGWIEIPKKKEY